MTVHVWDFWHGQGRAELDVGWGHMGNVGPISKCSLTIFVVIAKYILFMCGGYIHMISSRCPWKSGGACQLAPLSPPPTIPLFLLMFLWSTQPGSEKIRSSSLSPFVTKVCNYRECRKGDLNGLSLIFLLCSALRSLRSSSLVEAIMKWGKTELSSPSCSGEGSRNLTGTKYPSTALPSCMTVRWELLACSIRLETLFF